MTLSGRTIETALGRQFLVSGEDHVGDLVVGLGDTYADAFEDFERQLLERASATELGVYAHERAAERDFAEAFAEACG